VKERIKKYMKKEKYYIEVSGKHMEFLCNKAQENNILPKVLLKRILDDLIMEMKDSEYR